VESTVARSSYKNLFDWYLLLAAPQSVCGPRPPAFDQSRNLTFEAVFYQSPLQRDWIVPYVLEIKPLEDFTD